ncbi:MAG: hypothetical protein COA91_02930 [Robiginitomaculum sp.]|nr:MAG: hypothetical protein COA91_02930 [Robiginitomaculum sp.]
MIKFWQNSSGREKLLVVIATSLLGIFFLWQFAYKPLVNWPKAQERALKQAELDLKIMQKGHLVLQSQSGDTGKLVITMLATADFQTTITRLAKEKGLTISRRQPAGDKELTVWLESTKTTAFYAWVDDLTGKYNISLARVQLNRNDDASVRAQVTFVLGET